MYSCVVRRVYRFELRNSFRLLSEHVTCRSLLRQQVLALVFATYWRTVLHTMPQNPPIMSAGERRFIRTVHHEKHVGVKVLATVKQNATCRRCAVYLRIVVSQLLWDAGQH